MLEHFARTTQAVEKCSDPRFSSSYRVTTNALVNGLKTVASTLPLITTDEIKIQLAFKFVLEMDAMNALCFIPLNVKSKKLIPFQTDESVFTWSRTTMGCRPASEMQQAMNKHRLQAHRH